MTLYMVRWGTRHKYKETDLAKVNTRGSQTLWSQDPFTCLKIDDLKQLLIMLVTAINIYELIVKLGKF